MRQRFKSPASRLFTQPFIQTQIKENIKAPRHWPLRGNSPVTGEFPAEMASNAENVSIGWRHHIYSKWVSGVISVWRHRLTGTTIPIKKIKRQKLLIFMMEIPTSLKCSVLERIPNIYECIFGIAGEYMFSSDINCGMYHDKRVFPWFGYKNVCCEILKMVKKSVECDRKLWGRV